MDIPASINDKVKRMKSLYNERIWDLRGDKTPPRQEHRQHRGDSEEFFGLIQQQADEREAVFYAVAMVIEEEQTKDRENAAHLKQTSFAELKANSIKIPLEKNHD